MNNSVLRLYPLPNQERPLKGLYLEHNLRQYAERAAWPKLWRGLCIRQFHN